jgi:hypothetical protein
MRHQQWVGGPRSCQMAKGHMPQERTSQSIFRMMRTGRVSNGDQAERGSNRGASKPTNSARANPDVHARTLVAIVHTWACAHS